MSLKRVIKANRSFLTKNKLSYDLQILEKRVRNLVKSNNNKRIVDNFNQNRGNFTLIDDSPSGTPPVPSMAEEILMLQKQIYDKNKKNFEPSYIPNELPIQFSDASSQADLLQILKTQLNYDINIQTEVPFNLPASYNSGGNPHSSNVPELHSENHTATPPQLLARTDHQRRSWRLPIDGSPGQTSLSSTISIENQESLLPHDGLIETDLNANS